LLPASEIKFAAEYQDESERRCDMRQASRGKASPDPKFLEYRKDSKERRADFFRHEPSPERFTMTVQERLENGYHVENIRLGGKSSENGNTFQALVQEVTLRSNRHPLLKRFAAGTGKVRATTVSGYRRRILRELQATGIPLPTAASGLYDWGAARAKTLVFDWAVGKKVTLDDRKNMKRDALRILREEVGPRFAADHKQAKIIDRAMRKVAEMAVHCYDRDDDMSSGVLRSGPFNDVRYHHERKIFALDGAYINLRTDCAEIFRIELDRDFPDVATLLRWLKKRKVQPQVVVWFWDSRYPGRVIRPHFYFILPDKKGVWYGETKGTRMLHAVATAINKDYDGDPGCLANLFDGKNPLSPHSHYVICEENLKDLSQLCKILEVDLDQDLDRGMRDQCVQGMTKAGIDENASMAVYDWAWTRSRALLKLWSQTGSIRVNASLDRTALMDRVYETMTQELSQLDWKPGNAREREKTERALRCQARTAVERLGKGVDSRGWNVGAAAQETKQAVEALGEHATLKKKVEAAQRAGQAHRSRVVVERSVQLLRDHIAIATSAGLEPTVQSMMEATGLCEITVKKHWNTAVSRAAAVQILLAINAIRLISSSRKLRSPVRGIDLNTRVGETTNQDQTLPIMVVNAPMSRLMSRLRLVKPPPNRLTRGEHLINFFQAGPVRMFHRTGVAVLTINAPDRTEAA
jgi:hypothetical protein